MWNMKWKKNSAPKSSSKREAFFEKLEDRCILAAMAADVVFVMDATSSSDPLQWLDWVKSSIFSSSSGTPHPISQVLAANGFSAADVRYGLIGYGGVSTNERVHSFIVDPNPPTGGDPLFGTADQIDAAFENFLVDGIREDGWDGFEHLISEYKFRPGAVPVAILLQNSEGRFDLNDTLTRDGVFAALGSKNILVNSLVYGAELGAGGAAAPLFDLTRYGNAVDDDVRIFGVEADAADFVTDGQHNYVGIHTTDAGHPTVASAGATQSDAVQVSFNGSNTGAAGLVGAGKSTPFALAA